MKKGSKKTDSMKFSTDHRADILTEALVSLPTAVNGGDDNIIPPHYSASIFKIRKFNIGNCYFSMVMSIMDNNCV